ncbi:uncharacterized protein [Palaemon carinicauda]|uniref:uncharacterized protein n=1 Tax=Palaemon carinicauda TaxID=392227 RepID=UPI0035B577F3
MVLMQKVWRCLMEKRFSEKYAGITKDMYVGATTQVRSTVGATDKFKVKVGMHQGTALSHYMFDIVMDVMTSKVREEVSWSALLTDDILLTDLTRESVQLKIERGREGPESRGLKTSKTKTD